LPSTPQASRVGPRRENLYLPSYPHSPSTEVPIVCGVFSGSGIGTGCTDGELLGQTDLLSLPSAIRYPLFGSSSPLPSLATSSLVLVNPIGMIASGGSVQLVSRRFDSAKQQRCRLYPRGPRRSKTCKGGICPVDDDFSKTVPYPCPPPFHALPFPTFLPVPLASLVELLRMRDVPCGPRSRRLAVTYGGRGTSRLEGEGGGK
jgi:hypothetical protein